MSSLFHDGCDCGHDKKKQTSCKGCICEQLMSLEKCNTFTNQQFLIVLKGDSAALDLTGAGVGTIFTFVGFDPHKCCARFTYTSTADTTETFVIDCRSIAGLSSITTIPTPA